MPAFLTAYKKTARDLRTQLREAAVDHAAFETPLRPCDLSRCRATCCHDGAVLSAEEADEIRKLLDCHPSAFPPSARLEPITTPGPLKTATRTALPDECATDFPAHFTPTRCVFLDHDHKCSLQLLSIQHDLHPWFYKPLSCWMHPVLLQPAPHPASRPTLTLRTPENDDAGFASCTPCGRPDPVGIPARDALASELIALSELADRDFYSELHAPSAEEI